MENGIERREKQSLLAEVASTYHMEPAAFASTVKATVMPAGATNEQLAAFLLVCREYKLNPLTKQVYAFPTRGGGVVPMVGIDGWLAIINQQAEMDGIEFREHADTDGVVQAVTCTIHRKDRSHPTVVTEFLSECQRATDPWRQMPRRMLRHKAAIQCARYAFALSGLYDEDEARDIITREGAQPQVVLPPKPGASKSAAIKEELSRKLEEARATKTVTMGPEAPEEATEAAPENLDAEPPPELRRTARAKPRPATAAGEPLAFDE